MKKRKTFIVLFDLEELSDSRSLAENIENRIFVLDPNSEKLLAYDVLHVIIEEFEIPLSQKKYISVYPITDFMELYNNEECNEQGTFMSYVHAEMVD
jgi:hypothetical protein